MSKQDRASSNGLLQLTETIHIIADDKLSALAVFHSVDAKWINLSYAVTTNLLRKSTTSPPTIKGTNWTLRKETFLRMFFFQHMWMQACREARRHTCATTHTLIHTHTHLQYRFLCICSVSVAEFCSQNTTTGGSSTFLQFGGNLIIIRTNTIFFPSGENRC